jgi:serine/threonine-protein kinase
VAATTSAGRPLPTLAKYEVLEELGHGGMATVYRAHDSRLGRDVAVKVLHPHLRDSREVAHRFGVEAKAVAKLKHPNIVEVYDVSSDTELEQYLVVELLRGKTLRKLLQERGALPPEVAAALGLELLAALGHAHDAGVVHRDVKPENVLIEHRPRPSAPRGVSDPDVKPAGRADGAAPAGEPSRSGGDATGARVIVKLTDFGIAKLLDAQGVTSTGQVLGSPAHMAPEQIEGGVVDGRADVFGLGVLLYECMVGHLPFEGSNPAQVLKRVLDGDYAPAERERGEIGKAWSGILDRSLAREATNRFSDTAAMRDAITKEFRRLGIDSPRAELEAWSDEPEAYAEAHAKRMIARLCALGAEARKKRDALGAAADYNRAVAYAPHDAQLLRLVAGMHRAEARVRTLRKVVPMALGGVLLVGAAFGAVRFLKQPPRVDPTGPRSTQDPLATHTVEANSAGTRGVGTGSGSAAEVPSGGASAGSASSGTANPRTGNGAGAGTGTGTPLVAGNGTGTAPTTRSSGGPSTTSTTPPSPVKRAATISKIFPIGGVLVFLDGEKLGPADQNRSITVDDKAHVLRAVCVNDMCEQRAYDIPAGTGPVSLSIELTIKDARLVVQGNPNMHYGVREWPGVTVIPGAAANIPMKIGAGEFTLEERESGRTFSVGLRAGRETRFPVPELLQ